MRFRPASRAVILAAGLIAPWASGHSSSRADILVGSTVIPTSSVVSTSYLSSTYLPTSYVVPTSTYLPTASIFETGSSVYLPTTSYVTSYRARRYRPRRFVERTSYYGLPTSYLSPTTYYAPTTYVTPTSYLSSSLLPTSYVVPTVSNSAIFPTTYLSSSFVAPTSYLVDDGLIATSASSAMCCDTGAAASMAPSAATPTRSMNSRPSGPGNSGNAITSQPSTSNRSTERTPSATVNPIPGDQGMSSDVGPGVAPAPVPNPPVRTGGDVASPPPAPTAPADGPAMPAPGQLGGGNQPPQGDDRIDRSSLRPNYKGIRNILRGRVVSFESGSPEEAVTVVLTNRAGGFGDRTTQTDAFGEFKVSLPDGDWAVKVTMPSGSVYNVGRGITAGGGQVVDSSNNRTVTELRITR